VDDHHLTIEDGLTGNIEAGGDRGEPLDPVVAVAGEGLLSSGIGVELDAIAVVLIS
jgi:hypothetical protein